MSPSITLWVTVPAVPGTHLATPSDPLDRLALAHGRAVADHERVQRREVQSEAQVRATREALSSTRASLVAAVRQEAGDA